MKAIHTYRTLWHYGRTLLTGALAAAAMAAGGIPQAQAEDGKLYPGSLCTKFAGPNPVLNGSRIFNSGATVMRLDCPVIHDSLSYSIQDGYVDVIDQTASGCPSAASLPIAMRTTSTA